VASMDERVMRRQRHGASHRRRRRMRVRLRIRRRLSRPRAERRARRSAVPERRAPPLLSLRALGFPNTIEHSVDKTVGVFRTVLLGYLDGLVDGDLGRMSLWYSRE
jgi:hypothetical protein